eukprot:gene14894-10649_t
MTHINMERDEIFALHGVRQIVRGGGKVTHILKVKVSRHVSAEIADRIQTTIYNHIANVAIKIIVNDKPITVTWRPAEAAYPTYYHCNSVCFNDVGVHQHTKVLLRQLVDRLDADFDYGFSNGTLGFALLVSKLLGRKVNLMYNDIRLLPRAKRDEAKS